MCAKNTGDFIILLCSSACARSNELVDLQRQSLITKNYFTPSPLERQCLASFCEACCFWLPATCQVGNTWRNLPRGQRCNLTKIMEWQPTCLSRLFPPPYTHQCRRAGWPRQGEPQPSGSAQCGDSTWNKPPKSIQTPPCTPERKHEAERQYKKNRGEVMGYNQVKVNATFFQSMLLPHAVLFQFGQKEKEEIIQYYCSSIFNGDVSWQTIFCVACQKCSKWMIPSRI